MSDIPIRVDPEAPKNAIAFEQNGVPISAIANLAVPIQFPPPAKSFTLAESTVDDFDQLWDWARSDKIGVSEFLSQSHANSQTFFQQIRKILGEEREQRAWLRSVRRGDELCGFVMLSPIVKMPTLAATVHLYLTGATHTDAIADVLGQLPPQMTLMMVAINEDVARHFETLGFQSKIVLTRPPSGVDGHDGR